MDNSRERQNSGQKGLFISGIIVGMTGALVVLCAVYLGLRLQNLADIKHNGAPANGVVFSDDSAITPAMVQKLQSLESTIDKYFYLREVTEEELTDGIYRGMLDALDDPYSEYYTAEELNEIMNQTEGIYYGIGAYVSLDTDTSLPKISGVIEGAPAEEAQLRANDLIYEVDGKATYGLSLTEAVNMIKGEEGTQVTLTIIREGENGYLTITVERRRVESPTVEYQMLENNMAYIQITEFDDVTVDQFTDAVATMRGSGMEGMILDLRANPGGSLDAVVEIARRLLPKGLIVYTEDKNGKRVEYTCDGRRELNIPLVVLVDMNSASASEILAGAIQDYGIGTLVGTTTFGKGIVQQIIPFPDGSAIKVTISSYYTPNGRDIHGSGIEPDVVCEFDGEAYYAEENSYDNQLEKAKEVLMEIMGQ
ncbi:MAG: S41 family peptidase [Candidatus Gastranaerophilales bacterium]|nr:S41 family peptidase [Candidatus Gastranaerophilales bacterium]